MEILLTVLRLLFGEPKNEERSENHIPPRQSPLLQGNSGTEGKSEAQIPIKDVAICTQRSSPRIESVNGKHQGVSLFVGFEERWIKHYSNRQRILLVGEGDFSFSACLAVGFGYASNMVATSLDSLEFLGANYRHVLSNLNNLRTRKAWVMHGVDATKMANHAELCGMTFDRIIYNFPYAGLFKELPRNTQLRMHRRLVSGFIMNAKKMISESGEIHISHKTNEFHREWNLELIASSHGLELVEAVKFDQYDYPGYNTKYGFGGDNNFNCNPSKTYKFGFQKTWIWDGETFVARKCL